MKGLFQLLKYVKPYKGYTALYLITTLLSSVFNIVSFAIIIPFLNILFDSNPDLSAKPELTLRNVKDYLYYQFGCIKAEYGAEQTLIYLCGALIIVFFLKNVQRYMSANFLTPVRSGIIYDIRKQVFEKTLKLPLSYFSEQKKGDLISRMSSDVLEVEWAIANSLTSIIREPITIISSLIVMFYISVKLSLFILIILPISGIIIGGIGSKLKRKSERGQKTVGEINTVVEETLSGFRIIKGFGLEKKVAQGFDNLNSRLRRLNNSMTRKRELSSPLTEFLASVVIAVVMFYGGNLVFNNEMEPATFIFYIVVFSQIIPPAKAISSSFYNIQKGAASLDRIEEILKEEEKIVNRNDAQNVDTINESIQFKNVSFQYNNEPVLKNINLEIPKGKTIALVGQSGAGKSTLVDLIPRFYEATSGEVLLDNTNIQNLKIEDLRNLMGIVPQHSILFNDTIAANIAISEDNIDMSRVIEAAKIANAYEFISQLPQGFDTNIGDSGSKLSGGQRQRIAIARAIYKNPPILILDEATSALDTESEKLLQDALVKVMKDKTSIVIAHRLSTIQHADLIVVMQDGEIVEKGTHNELLTAGGVYKKLCDLQSFR